jgi:glycosyltransferase involved in cell wall biosynthesis
MREYYDLWDAYSGSLSVGGRLKERARRTWVHAADSYCFKHHVNRLFTISGTVRSRLERWNGVTGAVLHPPPPQRDYRCDEYGDFVFWASRLTRLKRADLLLRALARPETKGVRCVLAGEGPERERLLALRRDLGLESRVAMPGHLSEGQLLDHLARCRAVVFVPFQEDYGFVTVEAFAAGKPVITCDDSGGPVELVRHGENGWVVPPTADGVARAVVEAMDDDVARRRGAQGQVDIAPLTWDRVVDALVIV